MLQVKDNRTGKKADVRVMLDVKNEDIKNKNLQSTMKDYSMSNSQKLHGSSDSAASDLSMGDYLKGLNFVDFDTGKFEDDDASLNKKV